MYGVSADVTVKTIEQNRRILIEWNGPAHPSSVGWTFEPKGDRLVEGWAVATKRRPMEPDRR
jgi:hypothetical protein